MKRFLLGCCCWGLSAGLWGVSSMADELVILDETSVENLGIQTVPVSRQTFAETLFALGRIEVIPARQAVLSSRVPGRVQSLQAYEGDMVDEGAVLVVLESRQPGNPPPKAELRAPMTGLVSHGHVRLGEPVEPDRPLLEVVDLSEVYAVARVPEDQASVLQRGTRARIVVPAVPSLDFTGELVRLGTTVDAESGTVRAYFRVPNPGAKVRPNMRAEFSIVTRLRENVLAVPREALVEDTIGNSVFVEDFNLPRAYLRSPVQIGMKNEQFVEVKRGVFPGDSVVVSGAYPLAFAGQGSVSLKEALDAAHGHEHNEDGSEMTDADRAQHAGESHGGEVGSGLTKGSGLFLSALCLVLLGLLMLSQWQLHRLRKVLEGRRA